MSDLRKAAEMVIEAHDEGYGKIAHGLAIEELRQALAQPEREWVGLEEEEIVGMTCNCVDDGTFNMDCARDYARWIESNLKDKNHALR